MRKTKGKEVDYQEFIKGKSFRHVEAGFDCGDLPYPLFDYQGPIVRWALKRGKAAIFAQTGLGKTIMQLAWADKVAKHTGCPVLVLAPLAVSNQTIEEGAKYGIHVDKADPDMPMIGKGIVITNYEQLHKFNADDFNGIVIDESSILKGMDGRRRKEITGFAQNIPYRLSCTATPSPNDFMELGTQSEFLGIMSQVEMLAMFFIHDGGDVAKWRLKGHGESKFFQWLATWAVVIRKPEDLGFDGSRHALPELIYHSHVIETEPESSLFVEPAQGLQDRNKARKDSVHDRVAKAAEIANGMDGQVLIWCHLNEEAEILQRIIPGSVNVQGSDDAEFKVDAAMWFCGKEESLLSTGFRSKLAKLNKEPEWTEKLTSKNITSAIEKIALPSQPNTSSSTSLNDLNTCEVTQNSILKNLSEPLSNKLLSTNAGVQSMQPTMSTEKKPNKKSKSGSQQTPISDLRNGCVHTGSQLMTTNQCLQIKTEDALFADVQILDAQKEKGFTLITATNQEKFEDCSVLIAITDLENSKTQSNRSIGQLDTFSQHRSGRVLISKPRMFGYGLNLQSCNQMIFVGLSDSWESYYQAIRRCWRFGQQRPVTVHIVSADTEGAVIENIQRKDQQNKVLGEKMVTHMKTMMDKSIFSAATTKTEYNPTIKMELPKWLM